MSNFTELSARVAIKRGDLGRSGSEAFIMTKLGRLVVCNAHMTAKCEVCVNAHTRRTVTRSSNGVQFTGKNAD